MTNGTKTELDHKLSFTHECKIHDCLWLLDLYIRTINVVRSPLKSPTALFPKFQNKGNELIRFFEQFEETIRQFD